jgi:putative inorganic carbon (HCO3(-)) transporter
MSARLVDALPKNMVGNATFVIYCIYVVDYYVRVSSRIPGIGALRPTLVLFAVLVVLLVAQARNLKGRLTTQPAKALLVLLVYIFVTIPIATWPGSVVNNLEPYARAVAFFYFTILIVDTQRRLYIFLGVLVSSQLFRVLEPLFLNLTTGYLGDSTYLGGGEFAGRLSGAPHDTVNPNGLGFVAVTCIPYLYYCLFASKQRYLKVLALALIAACIYVLVLTLSRGAMVALGVIFWVVFTQSKRKVLFLCVIAAACVIGWNYLDDVHKDRYLSLVSKNTRQSYSAEGRTQLTELEFSIGMEHPVFGHGLGTTIEAKVHAGHTAQASHNLYTELLIELGFVGGFLFLGFLYSIHREVRRVARLVGTDKTGSKDDLNNRLMMCFTVLFWMYAVFSINYYGLSQDYWYALAGVVTAFGRQFSNASVPLPVTGGEPAESPRPRAVLARPRPPGERAVPGARYLTPQATWTAK